MALSAALCGIAAAGERTYYVDPDGNDNAKGISWASAFKTIQKGIDSTGTDDTVEVNVGTYRENLKFCGQRENMRCTITSTKPDDWNTVAVTIIDGNRMTNTVRLCIGANVRFSGFTVTGGTCGVRFEKGSPSVVSNCIIRNNSEAGVVCRQTDATVTDCIIRNNGNQGIFASEAYVVAKNNLIYDNNEGITIIGPYTTGILRNNTIVNNRSRGITRGGDANVMPANCIIWNNGNDLSGCSATYSCIKNVNDANGAGNITSDPCFVDAGKKNFHLGIHSPCVDAGNPSEDYSDQVDIDGEARVIGARVDIGADELNVPPPDSNHPPDANK
jgi:hypothetical protein